ncbi:MAG: SPFH domain-containing protein [Erysipelotrichaceae bacterium]|nr:SPFH domain-containing protein [Erysipelotrichaceae bacterium]
MGLIKALLASSLGTIEETWKDYFVCDSLSDDVLMAKGVKRGRGGSGEVITNGSGIVVNEGQCALIVDDGRILEVAGEPGCYTFDTSTSPSIFDGGLQGVRNLWDQMVERFTYGGDVNRSQRVYYVNTKEIMGNMFGTPTPIPFRIIDNNVGLDVEMPIRCNGEYTFRIVNPLLFYQNVAGNKAGYYEKSNLSSVMKAEILNALQPVFSVIAAQGVKYSEVPAHVDVLAQALRDKLQTKWGEERGIEFQSIALNSVSMDEENEKKLRDLQFAAVNRNKDMADANLIQGTVDAMKDAAKNPNGAVAGIAAVNMINNTGAATAAAFRGGNETPAPAGATWTCPKCGAVCTENFCPKCGEPKPAAKICPKCGKEVPATAAFCPFCGEAL